MHNVCGTKICAITKPITYTWKPMKFSPPTQFADSAIFLVSFLVIVGLVSFPGLVFRPSSKPPLHPLGSVQILTKLEARRQTGEEAAVRFKALANFGLNAKCVYWLVRGYRLSCAY